MNTYTKFIPNVFLAKCPERHEKGEVIKVTTQYGKENECIIFNLICEKESHFFYSIVRADGFNVQQWAARRADKLERAASNANKKSHEYYKRANKDSEFLSLMEPIKVGHHSEKRHRKIIEQAHLNMGKSVELSKKTDEYNYRAQYWKAMENTINLSMPESIEFYEHELEKAKAKHEGLKNGTIQRAHSYSFTYAKKELNEAERKYQLARKLWA